MNVLVNRFRRNGDTLAVSILIVFMFLFYVCWAFHLPSLFAPDETMRMDVPLYIFKHGCLPRGDDPEIINRFWGTSYGFSVYGSSLFAIPFMWASELFGYADITSLTFAARISNCVLAAINLVLIYVISKQLRFSKFASVLSVLLLGMLPQYAFLAAYFNSEQLEFLSTSCVIVACLNGKRNCWSYGSCVAVGLSLGLLALSYYFAYGAIIAAICFFYIDQALRLRAGNFSRREKMVELVFKPVVVFVSSMAVCGWFFIRNAILYNGDFIGMPTSSKTAEKFAVTELKPSNRNTLKSQGYPFWALFKQPFYGIYWPEWVYKSFIGVFGGMNIFIGETYYFLYSNFLLVGLLSGVVGALLICKSKQLSAFLVPPMLMVLIPVVLSIYYSWASDYQAQGRYVMAGFGILSLVTALGFDGLCTGVMVLMRKDSAIEIRHAIQEEIDGSQMMPIDELRIVYRRNKAVVLLQGILVLFYIMLFGIIVTRVILPSCFGGLV